MSKLNKELVLLILQFFDEEDLKEAAHELERESKVYFDLNYFEEMILSGNWEGAERYLSGFTKFDDNRYSTKIYFEIRKQKFLEALDRNDRAGALDILMRDLKMIVSDNEELFEEMTLLLTLSNIRKHDLLRTYGDTESARKVVMFELKKLIEANPLFHDKLKFPIINSQRLRRLINQSLNWQHIHCTNPSPTPVIQTLFEDHVCTKPSDILLSPSSENNLLPSQGTSILLQTSSDSSKSPLSVVDYSEICNEVVCLGGSASLAGTADCSEDRSTIFQKMPFETFDEETSSVSHFSNSHDSTSQKNNVLESCERTNGIELPKKVARTLHEKSSPMSMGFHPIKQTTLLVGTNIGEIGLWDVSSGEKLVSKNFMVWDVGACSVLLKTLLVKDPSISVNRIAWSPEGSMFGVAYSKHLVQIYCYNGENDVEQHLEIDAHVGGVNDIAFSSPHNQLLVITCGDDKTIKAWDATTAVKMFTFEGHNAPVYSVLPHVKEHVHFFFSTSVDGKIKAWLYDNLGSRVDYDAPGLGCTRLAYGGDRRLFSCGTNKRGDSFLVEWDECEGAIKRTYYGLQNNSPGIVQFEILKNQFLAASDGHVIKIWDVDKVGLLTTINVDGGLPATPHIQFNKDGSLLAVFTSENNIKILATNDGLQLLNTHNNCSADSSGVFSCAFQKLALDPVYSVYNVVPAEGVVKNRDPKESGVKDNNITYGHNILEINCPSQCQALWLPSHIKAKKISRLIYNSAGNAIVGLASNAVHLYWKWSPDELNTSVKATAEVSPRMWEPRNYLELMTDDIMGIDPEEAVPCVALSKNDSYLISASGGKISLFNMWTFKAIHSFMPLPTATTFLAFYPRDNNIIAIGKEDSIILIYNVRLSEVIEMLEGHSKKICSLAFSNALNVLVSSGADGQICVWDAEGWEKKTSRYVRVPSYDKSVKMSFSCYTSLQFYPDSSYFLAVEERHLAIYETKGLVCIKQWNPRNSAPISQATLSCDGQMVYATFKDGAISIFDALNLESLCRIIPSAYLPSASRSDVYPFSIAAHPKKPNQFAVGLTDGKVIVFEPLNAADKWSSYQAIIGSANNLLYESH